ncbi:hypothetical protein FZN37_004328 [Enterobacter hormaechei]|nr:hypothetical protein FZN37_004328 [Enterobacter hormaechei]
MAGTGVRHELRIRHRRGVHADLVRTGIEQPSHIFQRTHTAAHRQRNEHLRRHRFNDAQHQVAPVGRGRDVEEGDFVGALLVVAACDFYGVAGVAQFDKVDALDHPAVGHVQAGDDSFG